jgi:hypothetical protein
MIVARDRDMDSVKKSAIMGYAFAQATSAWATKGKSRFVWAEKAAAQGERNGFLWMGTCFLQEDEDSEDVANLESGKECYLMAAKLGHFNSMKQYAKLLDFEDPQRFLWLAKFSLGAVSNKDKACFLEHVRSAINGVRAEKSFGDFLFRDALFAMGRALNGHIDTDRKTIFGSVDHFNDAYYFLPQRTLFGITSFSWSRIEKQSMHGR